VTWWNTQNKEDGNCTFFMSYSYSSFKSKHLYDKVIKSTKMPKIGVIGRHVFAKVLHPMTGHSPAFYFREK
jgi:hypothetical protein